MPNFPKYPATGPNDFANIDLANLWNVLTGGGSPSFVAPSRPSAYTLTGTFNGAFTALFFDCSPIYADFAAGDQLLMTIESLNIQVNGPLLPPATDPILGHALELTWGTIIPIMEIPNSTALIVRMSLNQSIYQVVEIGNPATNHALNGPITIAPFIKSVGVSDPTIAFSLNSGATFNTSVPGLPFYTLTIKVEHVSA